jgi:hypothetical protein
MRNWAMPEALRRGYGVCVVAGGWEWGTGLPAKGVTQQSNRDDKNQRHRRTRGIVPGGHEVDMPAKWGWCCDERHGEEVEVAVAMATAEEDAAVARTVAAGWD